MAKNSGSTGDWGPIVASLPTTKLYEGRTCVLQSGVAANDGRYFIENGAWVKHSNGGGGEGAVATGWTPLTLVNGWVSYSASDSSFPVAAYRRSADGTVSFRGMVKSGSTGTIATLPVGFRPASTVLEYLPGGGGIADVRVNAAGAVYVSGYPTGNNSFISLDEMTFTVAEGPFVGTSKAIDAPIGAVQSWTSSALPDNGDWMICDGRTLSATDYPEGFNFAKKSRDLDGANSPWTYNATAQTFTVPDLQNRFIYGASAGTAFGTKGGASTVTLTTAQLPAHGHPLYIATTAAPDGGQAATGSPGSRFASGTSASSTTQPIGPAGSGSAHENMPPYVALGWIVRVRSTVQAGGMATAPSVYRPNIAWYDGGADAGSGNGSAVTELRNSSNQSSRIIIPPSNVPQTFAVSLKATVTADSSNWSPFYVGTRVLRSSDGALLGWAGQAYGNSNRGRNPQGGTDWSTVVAEGDYTPPTNTQVELQPVSVFFSQFGGVYSRSPDASQFKATRIG